MTSSTPERRAPQKQCKEKVPHDPHHYAKRETGLIWWCQGRRRA